MSPELVINIGQKAIETTIFMSGPMLLAAMIIGLLISIFQAATQINEQTMTFVPKIIAVFVTLLFFAPWMIQKMLAFTRSLLEMIATI